MTVTSGSSEVVIEIPIIADNVTEDAENFTVLLSNPSDGVTFVNSVAIINIADHDGELNPSLCIATIDSIQKVIIHACSACGTVYIV